MSCTGSVPELEKGWQQKREKGANRVSTTAVTGAKKEKRRVPKDADLKVAGRTGQKRRRIKAKEGRNTGQGGLSGEVRETVGAKSQQGSKEKSLARNGEQHRHNWQKGH